MTEDTELTCTYYLSTGRGEYTADHQAKIFHSLLLLGNLRSTICWITYTEKCGVFQPGDIFPKTAELVLEVLHSKHTHTLPTTTGSFESYKGQPPAFVPVDVANKAVASVA